MTHGEGFWNSPCRSAASARPDKFLPYADILAFNPSLFEEVVDEAVPGGKDPVDTAPAVLELLANHLASVIEAGRASGDSRHPLLVGVQKKGMSLLNELRARLSLPPEHVIDDKKFRVLYHENALHGRTIVFVDDTIHRGVTLTKLLFRACKGGARQISAVTTLANDAGLDFLEGVRAEDPPASAFDDETGGDEDEDVSEEDADLDPGEWSLDAKIPRAGRAPIRLYWLLRIPEQKAFSMLFVRHISPLLESCARGAIANRRQVSFYVTHSKLNLEQQAASLLTTLTDLRIARTLTQHPSSQAFQTIPVFRGTLRFTADYARGLATRYAHYGEPQQEKLRVFIAAREGLEVHLSPIRWFKSKPGVTRGQYLRDIETIAGEMAQEIGGLLREALLTAGFEVQEAPISRAAN